MLTKFISVFWANEGISIQDMEQSGLHCLVVPPFYPDLLGYRFIRYMGQDGETPLAIWKYLKSDLSVGHNKIQRIPRKLTNSGRVLWKPKQNEVIHSLSCSGNAYHNQKTFLRKKFWKSYPILNYIYLMRKFQRLWIAIVVFKTVEV